MTDIAQAKPIVEIHIQEQLAFGLEVLGMAGHTVTDPYILSLAEAYSSGEIDGNKFRKLGQHHRTAK